MEILIASALAALASQASPPTTAPPAGSAQFVVAQRLLDERLLDYPSARFRDVRGDERILCGFVNSKNRMGAYVGWTRFAVTFFTEEPRVMLDDPDGADDVLLDAFCGDDGQRLSGRDYSTNLTRR